jgi:hypothetical protein
MERTFLRSPPAEHCTITARANTAAASRGPLLLAFRAPSTYRRTVSIFRAFAVICFLLGLSVQAAAQAAAVPQMPPTETIDCAEMAQGMTGQMAKKKQSDRSKPCDNMSLSCLVAMGCLAQLALPGSFVADPALPITDAAFPISLGDGLEGRLIRPESPPPQTLLTV